MAKKATKIDVQNIWKEQELSLKEIKENVLNNLLNMPGVPNNYKPKIVINNMYPIQKEDIERLSTRITYGLKIQKYPKLYKHFYPSSRPIKGVQELMNYFCTYLDFVIVDPAVIAKGKYLEYDEGKQYLMDPYEKNEERAQYTHCTHILNEIAMMIVHFAFKFRGGCMTTKEKIVYFFDGKFFKAVDKSYIVDIKCSDDGSKRLLVETAKYWYKAQQDSQFLPRAQELCQELLEAVKEIFFWEENLLEQAKKQSFSIGGSKGNSKFSISDEQKESFYQEFANKNSDAIVAYKMGKRGTINMLSWFIWKQLKNDPKTSQISEATTRKWAKDLMRKHCNDSKDT